MEEKGTVDLKEGEEYKVEIVYSPISTFPERTPGDLGGGAVRLGVTQVVDPEVTLADAAKIASEADTVILCVGTDGEWESESYDRKDMK